MMLAHISKFHNILLFSLIFLIMAGTAATADTNGFSLNSSYITSSSIGYFSTLAPTVIPTTEPVELTTPDIIIPTTTALNRNNLQPVITESPEQPTLTVIETIPKMIIPDTTIAISKVSETTVETPKLNESIFSQQNSQEAVSGEVTEDQARSDPPLNTSSDNPYYSNSNNNWVINESGHDWIMDLDLNHNNGSGVTFNLSTKTFSNFGSTFAILINASDVYFDGMGAILDGSGKTKYGILVNNQSTGSYDTFSSDSANELSGISIKNITLINFLNTGIFFNNVIDTLSGSGSISSNITNVNSSYNGKSYDDKGRGIVIQNSNGIEVSSNSANNNGEYGIFLNFSNNNNVTGNTAADNQNAGFYISKVSNISLNNNNASGNHNFGGFFVSKVSNSNLNNNNASGNQGFGLVLADSSNNTLTNNTASNNYMSGLAEEWCLNNTFYENIANDNLWSGFDFQTDLNNTLINNTATGNHQNGFNFYLSSNNTINGNTAINNSHNGFYLDSSSKYNQLNSNTVINNTYYGFYLDGSLNNDLTGNNATDNQADGFYLNSGSSNNLTDNIAMDNYLNGFNLIGSSYNNLTNNTATDNKANGFELQANSNNNLDNNKANNNAGYGFILIGSSYNNLTSNSATNNLMHGFYFSGSSYNNLTSNSATKNSGYGFFLDESSNNSLNRNTATANKRYLNSDLSSDLKNIIKVIPNGGFSGSGFALSSSSYNHLINNTAIGNEGDGFYLDSSLHNNLTGNIASGNLWNGFNLSRSSNNNLTGNNALVNHWNGFYFNGSNNNLVTGNDGTGQDIGFDVKYSDSSTFTGNKGCYVWINSSFIPVDINYCTTTPSPTETPSPSSVPVPPLWNNAGPSTSDIRTTDSSLQHPYDMQFLSSTIPAGLNPGQIFTGIITVKNTGTTTWTSEGVKFGLRPFGDALKFGIGDIMLPPGTTVEPGQEFSFQVTLTAPLTGGTYDLQFRTFFLTPSNNGNPVPTFFGDIININTDVSSNTKKTELLKKKLGSIVSSMSQVVTQTKVAPIITLINELPTPVWKPTPYLSHPTAIETIGNKLKI